MSQDPRTRLGYMVSPHPQSKVRRYLTMTNLGTRPARMDCLGYVFFTEVGRIAILMLSQHAGETLVDCRSQGHPPLSPDSSHLYEKPFVIRERIPTIMDRGLS